MITEKIMSKFINKNIDDFSLNSIDIFEETRRYVGKVLHLTISGSLIEDVDSTGKYTFEYTGLGLGYLPEPISKKLEGKVTRKYIGDYKSIADTIADEIDKTTDCYMMLTIVIDLDN